jgi:enolase
MKIEKVIVNEILDSRGEPTIEVLVATAREKVYSGAVPSGKSRGKREAAVLTVDDAQKAAVTVNEAVKGKSFGSVGALDKFLIELDGTPEKNKLGGNLMLGISLAFARALAGDRELWEIVREEYFPKKKKVGAPMIFSNLVNGGAHAKNNLDIQEFMVIVRPTHSIVESVIKLKKFYFDLGVFLKKEKGVKEIALGDEGGYSLPFDNNAEPIKILEEQAMMAGLTNDFHLGLDAAASGFHRDDYYIYEGRKTTTDELKEIYLGYFNDFPLLYSIEDPFAEDDDRGFGRLKLALNGRVVVGDDLTTTDPFAIRRCAKENLINGVIIKANQIGTVTETCEAIKAAQENDIKVILSHRSGETPDCFLIHLAKASGADGVKIGAPVRERILKFNELARIYK